MLDLKIGYIYTYHIYIYTYTYTHNTYIAVSWLYLPGEKIQSMPNILDYGFKSLFLYHKPI